ncbi:heterokaryon incompatibility protein-domain-containing protein [Aspergillus cavernicola]|uniref:Heterokaryon incompatibility protein-domain-containing protein n=1 Tax=Aspergillus cavernicola TaxID=176166 RepID=A0ABR4IZ53_9EURO
MLCSLADLHATSGTCALCGLVMEALLRRWGPGQWSTADEYVEWAKNAPGLDASLQIYLFSFLFAEDRYGGAKTPPSPPNHYQNKALTRPAFRLGVALRGPSDENIPYLDHAGDIQLLSTNSLIYGSRASFLGRIINPDRANIQLAREWIDECEQGHGDLCETAGRGDDVAYTRTAPRNLRVINVNSMCLVLLPAEAKYVALSYCWAQSTRHFTTTTSNVAGLQACGGISGVWDELPGTIQDAIGCVREIGREFLWVDALCIIQDDNKDKEEQILQMDRVYDNALLTIIPAPPAAESSSRYDGLPGYRPDRQPSQAMARIQGLELCTTHIDVEQATSTSPWNYTSLDFSGASALQKAAVLH